MNERERAVMEQVTRGLIDEGKLIEAGWVGLRMMAVPKDASERQIVDMRSAFFAGAQHLYASIMTMLDPDAEPTKADERRMEAIDAELKKFIREYEATHLRTKGNA